MPRSRRSALPERFVPNLTPLLDVVLQLITFFMMLIHFGTRIEGATLQVRLPETPAALPSGELKLDKLVVAIDAQGRLLVEDAALDAEAAERYWTMQADGRRRALAIMGEPTRELNTLIVVRADRDTPYGGVRDALRKAQQQGFVRFSLMVLRSAE